MTRSPPRRRLSAPRLPVSASTVVLCCPAIQLLYVNVGPPLWRLLLSWLDGGPTVNTYSLSCLGRQPLTCSIQSILGTAGRARAASNSSN